MRTALVTTALTILTAGSGAAADFPGCLASLKRSATEAGVGRDLSDRALDISEPNTKVLELSTVQPEFKIPIWDYLAYLVDDQRIADGRAMLRQHDALLRDAERRFGVDRHVIVAVWGVETDYGGEVGSHFLPHALATLSCRGGRRADFWRSELIAALQLVQRGDLALDDLFGSWAGAFGQTQFIPSTYRRLAIDFDGDGRRDLVRSVPDALGSTANYLNRAGWQPGGSWLVEVKVPAGYDGPSGRQKRASLTVWDRRGIVRADGARLSGSGEAGLLLPSGPTGPGFLVFPNFDAIYAYNHAESYALAISHLADRIAGLPALRTPWPTDDPGLSRAERRRLQELLIAAGYNIGAVDGRIGSRTRAGIREAEQQLGLPITGRPGRRIYESLGGE